MTVYAKNTTYGLESRIKEFQDYLNTELPKKWCIDVDGNQHAELIDIFGIIYRNERDGEIVPEAYTGTGIRQKEYEEVLPEKDCFITLNTAKFPGDTVNGGGDYLDFGSFYGYGRRTLIRFDLSEEKTGIPDDAVIHKARMRLYYKPAGRDERIDIVANRLVEPFGEYYTQDELEDIGFHDNFDYIAEKFVHEEPGFTDFYLNPLVQEWITGKYPNYGMVIKAEDEALPNLFPQFAAVQNDVLDRLAQLGVDLVVDGELAGVHDAHGQAGVYGVVEKDGVDRLAHRVVAPKRERDVRDAARGLGVGEGLVYLAHRLDKVHAVVVVLVYAGGYGEDVRVEDDVLGREADLLREDLVRPSADLDLPVLRVRLTLLVKGHHDNGGPVPL